MNDQQSSNQRLEHLEHLLNIASALRPDMPLDELGCIGLETLCGVGGYEIGALWITDEQQSTLTLLVTYGFPQARSAPVISLAEGQRQIQQAQRSGIVHWLPRTPGANTLTSLTALMDGSATDHEGHFVFLPLVQTELVGIVVAASPLPQPDADAVQTIKEYADQIATSFIAAMLYHQRQQTVQELRAALEHQQRLQRQLIAVSAPVLPVLPQVLLLPIIGDIDNEQAEHITTTLLHAITTHKATVVLLDVTGILMLDTHVAAHLIQASEAAWLLGCRTVLVGIRPEIAQVIVSLGIDLKQFVTKPSLEQGLAYALHLCGWRIDRGT